MCSIDGYINHEEPGEVMCLAEPCELVALRPSCFIRMHAAGDPKHSVAESVAESDTSSKIERRRNMVPVAAAGVCSQPQQKQSCPVS